MSVLPLSETRGKKWRRKTDENTRLTYLTLPKGTILWRGYNPKQKRDRPQFFSFHRAFAARYGDVHKWKTARALRLIEAHYPIELDECCLANAHVLETLASDDSPSGSTCSGNFPRWQRRWSSTRRSHGTSARSEWTDGFDSGGTGEARPTRP